MIGSFNAGVRKVTEAALQNKRGVLREKVLYAGASLFGKIKLRGLFTHVLRHINHPHAGLDIRLESGSIRQESRF